MLDLKDGYIIHGAVARFKVFQSMVDKFFRKPEELLTCIDTQSPMVVSFGLGNIPICVGMAQTAMGIDQMAEITQHAQMTYLRR